MFPPCCLCVKWGAVVTHLDSLPPAWTLSTSPFMGGKPMTSEWINNDDRSQLSVLHWCRCWSEPCQALWQCRQQVRVVLPAWGFLNWVKCRLQFICWQVLWPLVPDVCRRYQSAALRLDDCPSSALENLSMKRFSKVLRFYKMLVYQNLDISRLSAVWNAR